MLPGRSRFIDQVTAATSGSACEFPPTRDPLAERSDGARIFSAYDYVVRVLSTLRRRRRMSAVQSRATAGAHATTRDSARRSMKAVTSIISAGLLVTALAGCSATVYVKPGPSATSVACAGIVARAAQLNTIGGQPLRQVDEQGVAAWGNGPSVTLQCGVAKQVVSSRCLPVDGVDWAELDKPNGIYELTSFGRSPIVEVVIDGRKASSEDILPALSDIVSQETHVYKRCSN
jgi:hypothetical protein